MNYQPSVYTKEKILDAAFALLRERGWSSVSTRAIADKLGSSTMPIYSHVKSVEELEKELRYKAYELLKEFQKRKYTDQTLLNVALGYVIFARDEKKLFRFIYFEKPDKMDWGEASEMKDAFFTEFGEQSEEGRALSAMQSSSSGQETVVRYTWIFTHGLASLANSGVFDSCSEQIILRYLMDAGEAFFNLSLQKDKKEVSETAE